MDDEFCAAITVLYYLTLRCYNLREKRDQLRVIPLVKFRVSPSETTGNQCLWKIFPLLTSNSTCGSIHMRIINVTVSPAYS